MSNKVTTSRLLQSGTEAEQRDDLTLLPTPTDESIVSALRARYQVDNLYTRIHDSALVVVNPNKDVSASLDPTSQNYVADYRNTSTGSHPLPPHVFQLVNRAYMHMRRSGEDQTILLVGESGS